MYFLKLTVFLSSFYITSGFFHHRKHGINFLLEEFEGKMSEQDQHAVQTLWIDQPVDHFDKKEVRKWKMRYFQRLDMWKPNGPIYLFLGGEGRGDPRWLNILSTVDLVNETNGAFFASEHRYYGESKLFKNLTTENLKFLSSRQSLADNVRLLLQLKSLPQFKTSKVVVVGGSYPGNLAAWMKLLYPDLVDAAIASSAPVLAKLDFYEYLETVGDDFEQYGTPGCYDHISKIFARYEDLLKTADGIKQLKKEENICENSDMTKPENQQVFFDTVITIFQEASQFRGPSYIQDLCKRLSLSTENNLSMMREKESCYDMSFDNMLLDMVTKQVSRFLWTYQTCTEFGYFQTGNSKKQPFGNVLPLSYYIKTCQGLFGPNFDEKRVAESVRKSNEYYEGLHPNVTNVVFVNGAIDPWHRLGVLKDLSNDAPAKLITLGTHCSDLIQETPQDPEEVKEARIYIKKTIKKWIGA